MNEQEYQQPEEHVPYVPRPKWQVWAARIGLAIFLIGLVLYYCNLFGGVR